MTQRAVLDGAFLTRLIGRVDAQQASKLVGLFTATARNDLATCRQHLAEGNGARLAFAMHKLKSSARTVGAMRFAETAESIEEAGRTARVDEATRLFAELEDALAEVEGATRADSPLWNPSAASGTMAGGTNRAGTSSESAANGRPDVSVQGMQSALTQDAILDGIHCDEFEIHFQPVMEAVTMRVVGVEALARWRHKGRYVPPTLFIAAAERFGLISILSEALLSKSLVGSARLAERGFPLPVSINLSALWLSNIHVPELINACVVGTGLKPEDVTLEIAEAGLADGMAAALGALMRLRLMGFRLSIDDFGADAISLDQLDRFEVNELKIDSGVLHKATQGPAARSVFAATVAMARELMLGSVAQGIECSEHLELARNAGCDLVQGWFIAPPMPGADVAVWLQERHE